MIHGYNVIFGAYGFWLPNDPRGSWSEFVAAWELLRFGPATKGIERAELTPEQNVNRLAAKNALRYPAVQFSGVQARAVGKGLGIAVSKSNLTIWRCSILPEHIHLVIARHTFKVEYIVGLLKGEATKQLKSEGLHPLANAVVDGQDLPTPWASKCWRVYLDCEEAIENAIHYVDQNPVKEGKPQQKWSFESGYQGLDKGWVAYH
jgi:REP element-mobilizing transposase RayT